MSRKGGSRMDSETSLPHLHPSKYKCHHCNKSLDGVSMYGGDDLISGDNISIYSARQRKSIEVKMPQMKKIKEDPEALPHTHTTTGPCYFCSEHKEQYEKLDRFQPTWRAKSDESSDEEFDGANCEILRLHAVLDQTEKKNIEIKADLKKLEVTKKEKDAKVIMDTIYNQLDDHLKMHQQTEKEIEDLQDEIRKKLGKPAPRVKEEDKSDRSSSSQNKKMASPEQQVLTYELKSQLLRNVEMQNHRLKTELTLHEKMTEAKLLNQQNKRLTDDNTMSKTNTLRLMKMFEKKAKDADVKLKEMQQELTKAQQLARKYHQMYDMERRRNGYPEGANGTPEPELGTPRQNTNANSFLGSGVRVNDVIRKNEVLLEENEKLHREVARLKQDNSGLIKKCKHAMSDKDGIVHRLDTSEANRKELSKRLDKERNQHQNLSRSLTRQASDWILLKKQLAQFDEEYRWSQMKQQCEEGKQRFGLLPPIYYYMPLTKDNDLDLTYYEDDDSLPPENVGPVNPHGADQRTYAHPVPRNVYQPRRMLSPENYASQSTA